MTELVWAALVGALVLVIGWRERAFRRARAELYQLFEARVGWMDAYYERMTDESFDQLKHQLPIDLGDNCYAVGRYKGNFHVRSLKILKAGGLTTKHRKAMIERMAVDVVGVADALGLSVSIVTPAPSTAANVRARGYDHVDELARAVARRMGAPYRRTLEKAPGAASQVAVRRRAARLENMRRAITGRDVPAGLVLVVDDVSTTGATLEACAEALRSGGAVSVVSIVLASDRRAKAA